MAAESYDYTSVAKEVEEAVRDALPGSFVGTEPGYSGHVHLKVVSEVFRGLTEEQKQHRIWEILRDKLGSKSQCVSLALVFGPDEL